MSERSLYELNVAIARADAALRKLDKSNPAHRAMGERLVRDIRALEEEYRVLRAATPRNYEGL